MSPMMDPTPIVTTPASTTRPKLPRSRRARDADSYRLVMCISSLPFWSLSEDALIRAKTPFEPG